MAVQADRADYGLLGQQAQDPIDCAVLSRKLKRGLTIVRDAPGAEVVRDRCTDHHARPPITRAVYSKTCSRSKPEVLSIEAGPGRWTSAIEEPTHSNGPIYASIGCRRRLPSDPQRSRRVIIIDAINRDLYVAGLRRISSQ